MKRERNGARAVCFTNSSDFSLCLQPLKKQVTQGNYLICSAPSVSNQRQPTHCCQICQRGSKSAVQRGSQVASVWHAESKSWIKGKVGEGVQGHVTGAHLLFRMWAACHKGLWCQRFPYIPLRAITVCTCSLKQNLYPWFKRHLQCISLVVITRNSIRRNRCRPRPNWKA